MRAHELDQILVRDKEVTPSARFTDSVMNRVRAESSAPLTLTFPWIRALPGLAAGLFALIWLVVEGVLLVTPRTETPFALGAWFGGLAPWIARADAAGFRWVLLALFLTAACVELSWRASERRAWLR
jgi:hypothetical protein